MTEDLSETHCRRPRPATEQPQYNLCLPYGISVKYPVNSVMLETVALGVTALETHTVMKMEFGKIIPLSYSSRVIDISVISSNVYLAHLATAGKDPYCIPKHPSSVMGIDFLGV